MASVRRTLGDAFGRAILAFGSGIECAFVRAWPQRESQLAAFRRAWIERAGNALGSVGRAEPQ